MLISLIINLKKSSELSGHPLLSVLLQIKKLVLLLLTFKMPPTILDC